MRLEVRDADTFIRLHFSNAESLDVTPHHIFTLADGSPMRAERLCLSDILVGRFARLTLTKIEVITPSALLVGASATPALSSRARSAARGLQATDEGSASASSDDDAHRGSARVGSADVECGGLPPLSRVSACRDAAVEASFDHKTARASSRTPHVPTADPCRDAAGPPTAPAADASAVSEATPWQKVSVSCEPSHEFFAGRHSASILTHNYTFSS